MAKRGRKTSLSKLEEQRKSLDERIKAAKKDEQAAQTALRKKRFAIIGSAVAAELEENEALARQLEPVINKRITRASDRKLLGLPPLTK